MINPEHVLQIFFEHFVRMQKLRLGCSNALPPEINASLLANCNKSFRHVLLTFGLNFFLMPRLLGRKYYPNPLFFNNLMQKRVRVYVPFFLWRPFVDPAYLDALYGRSVHMKIMHRQQPFDAFITGYGDQVVIQKRGEPTTPVELDFSWKHMCKPIRFIEFCTKRRLLLVVSDDGAIILWLFDSNLSNVEFKGSYYRSNPVMSIKAEQIGEETVFAVIRSFGPVELLKINSHYQIVPTSIQNRHDVPCSVSYPLEGYSMIFAQFCNKHFLLYGSIFGMVSCWQLGDHPPRKVFNQQVHDYLHHNQVRMITYVPERSCFRSVSSNGKTLNWSLTFDRHRIPEGIAVEQ